MDKGCIVTLVLIVLILISGFFGMCWQVDEARKDYNHGICTECGGDYRFSSGIHYKNGGDRYYYTCEDCGHTIVTYSIMK